MKREWGGGWGPGGERDNTVYGEPVNVQARDDGRPARFVWRGRLYTVHAILEHWVINREWWQDPEAEPGQPELEFWRVEASPGQSACFRAAASLTASPVMATISPCCCIIRHSLSLSSGDTRPKTCSSGSRRASSSSV